MPTTQATIPLLHKFLGIGLMGVAAACVVLRYFGIAPLPQDSVTPVIAYTLSGIAVVMMVVAIFVFKPRVRARAAGQPLEQYWSTPDVGAKILPLWFLLEGAGTVAAVGYLLTGEAVSAIAAGAAIVAFWLNGPQRA